MRFDPIPGERQPATIHPPYGSTLRRGPKQPPVVVSAPAAVEAGVRFAESAAKPGECDMTLTGTGEALGQRIVVTGRIVDEDSRPVRGSLVEVWQCNAAGRYTHAGDQHNAPLDPNFSGDGRMLTDDDGRYRFVTIRPGEYPWRNHYNAWRPAHIHLSVFGHGFMQRLVTQFYFPGDPLLEYDPMYMSVPDERARRRLIAEFDWEHTAPEHAIAYRFDIVLRGRDATPMERP